MKRNKKYYKELPKKNFMNRLKHIVILFLGIGILSADDPPEEFAHNASSQQAFYYFDLVLINEIEVASNDWVGAFNGDVCVGARKWDTSLCGGGKCDVPVLGDDGFGTDGYMQSGDIPTFKIFDASNGEYYDAVITGDITDDEGNIVSGAWSNMGFYNIVLLEVELSIPGCTDPDYCNYDPSATDDDGSCEELDDCGECGGNNSNCLGENYYTELTIGSNEGGFDGIDFNSDIDIAGFQFNIEGNLEITAVHGGAAEDHGFTCTTANNTVLCFSPIGEVIPAGSGRLVGFSWSGDSCGEVCVGEILMADSSGNAVNNNGNACAYYETGDCGGNEGGFDGNDFNRDIDIAGFQFNIEGNLEITAVQGGAA